MIENTGRRTYKAYVEAVFSGDDLILMIDLNVDSLHKRKRVRLDGVLVPSAVRQTFDSEAGKIRGMVRGLIIGKTVNLIVTGHAENSWTGIIEVESAGQIVNVNELLISMGFGFTPHKAIS